VVGEQAQKNIGADAILVPMVDGPHVEIDGFAAAKGVFDGRQGFVGKDRRLGIEFILGHRGAQHIDPVQLGFGRDRGVIAGEGEIILGDGANEVLAILLRLNTMPTASPMAAAPRSGRRLRRTRVWMTCKACSVAASSRCACARAPRRAPGCGRRSGARPDSPGW
jgi:hypothetical protein